SFKKEQLDYALKLGKVLVILDGFDEVNSEDRENIEKEILYLSNNYHGVKYYYPVVLIVDFLHGRSFINMVFLN
ncbi:hypothetical protein ACV78R_002567, partial [Acinetobacter baumannii]